MKATSFADPAGDKPRLVVTVIGIGQILAWGSTFYLPAVAARPIAADTGWPLPWVIGGLSLGLLVAGMISPLIGRAIDRTSGRSTLATSSIIIAAGLICLSLAPTLALYGVAWAIMGAGMAAGLYDAAFATLGQLFGDRARLAITSLTLIAGFASTLMWPLGAFLIERIGWRDTCLVYAVLQVAVALPLYLRFVPGASPGSRTRPARARPTTAAGGLLRRDQRLPFVLIAAALSLGGMVAAVLSVHLIGVIEEAGFDLAAATGMAALVGPSQVGARVAELAFGRRYYPVWTLIAAGGLMAGGLALLMLSPTLTMLGVVLYGAGNGIQSIARGTVPLAFFGPENYPALMGRLALPNLIGQALSPTIAAVLIAEGAEISLVALLTALATASALLGLLLLPRKEIDRSRG